MFQISSGTAIFKLLRKTMTVHAGKPRRTLRTSAVATKVVVVIVVDHDGARGGVVIVIIVVVDCAPQHTSSTLKTKRAVDSATEHISQSLQHKKKR